MSNTEPWGRKCSCSATGRLFEGEAVGAARRIEGDVEGRSSRTGEVVFNTARPSANLPGETVPTAELFP